MVGTCLLSGLCWLRRWTDCHRLVECRLLGWSQLSFSLPRSLWSIVGALRVITCPLTGPYWLRRWTGCHLLVECCLSFKVPLPLPPLSSREMGSCSTASLCPRSGLSRWRLGQYRRSCLWGSHHRGTYVWSYPWPSLLRWVDLWVLLSPSPWSLPSHSSPSPVHLVIIRCLGSRLVCRSGHRRPYACAGPCPFPACCAWAGAMVLRCGQFRLRCGPPQS